MPLTSKPLVQFRQARPRWTQPASFYGLSVFRSFARLHPVIYGVFVYSLLFSILSPQTLPHGVSAANVQGCIASGQFNANTDYFPDKAQVNSDASFRISYTKSTKRIVDVLSNKTTVLVQCGAPTPSDIPSDAVVIQVPVKKVGLMDTTPVTFLEVLGVRSSIALTTSIEYISSPCIQSAVSSNSLTIGNINATNEQATLTQLQGVDVYFQFFDPLAAKIKNAVAFPATSETLADVRTQWMHFLGAFYNKEKEANEAVKTITTSYACVSEAAQAMKKTKGSPIVAWTSYDGPASWNNNTASWTISTAKYKVDFTQDAGATFIDTSSFANSTVFYDQTLFLSKLENVDILVDESLNAISEALFMKNYGFTNDNKAKFKFMKNKQVWQANKYNNPDGGDPWFESAVAFTHLVVADLTMITHPSVFSNYGKAYQTSFFRNIFETPSQVVISASLCTADDLGTLRIPTIECDKLSTKTSAGTWVQPLWWMLAVFWFMI